MGIIKFLMAGLFLGLPFGPIGIMCMGKTIQKGKKAGRAAILGAIVVDVIYGIIAFLMLIPIKKIILENEFILKILIGIYLIIIGATKLFGKIEITNLKSESDDKNGEKSSDNLSQEFMKIFLMSLPNVFNIITIITLFTGLEVFKINEEYMIPKLIFGILSGTISLWLFTTYILEKLRNKITENTMIKIVRICGLGIIIFGIILEIEALFR